MKKLKKIFFLTVLFIILINHSFNIYVKAATEAPSETELFAKSAVLLDGDSGRVLYNKDGNTPMPMASTTKIMTLIVVLENAKLSDTVTVSKNAARQPKVHLGMREKQQFKLEDLCYSLMLESHNDSAVALAEHVGGSVEKFAAMMNEKARDIGCTNTYYITPILRISDNSNITPSTLDSMNLILQEVPQEIVLRGIGDVKDELDLTRGEYIQRIGEATFDGSSDENWVIVTSTTSVNEVTTLIGIYGLNDAKPENTNESTAVANNMVANNYAIENIFGAKHTTEGCTLHVDNSLNRGHLMVRTKMLLTNAQQWEDYLQTNPLVVQYELKTPIIHKVNLTNTKVIQSYATETHYETITPSDSLIPNITIPSTLNYDVAIKPSTEYTIRANTSDNLTVDLGGATGTLSNGKVTLTTPATLTHNEVKFSGTGKVKELMVVEGNEIKDNVPFFNGMKDVQMGGIKLVNIARGATCNDLVTANANKTQFTYTGNGSGWGYIWFDTSLFKPNTKYTLYVKAKDKAGNESAVVSRNFDVDLAAPLIEVSLSSGTKATTEYFGSTFNLVGTITDSNGDRLSTIDLTNVHAGALTQYTSETKIL